MAEAGVVTLPPSAIRDSVKAEVAKVLADLPTDKHQMVELAVSLQDGVNLVYGYRGANGWEAAAYVGRQWHGEMTAGVLVRRLW